MAINSFLLVFIAFGALMLQIQALYLPSTSNLNIKNYMINVTAETKLRVDTLAELETVMTAVSTVVDVNTTTGLHEERNALRNAVYEKYFELTKTTGYITVSRIATLKTFVQNNATTTYGLKLVAKAMANQVCLSVATPLPDNTLLVSSIDLMDTLYLRVNNSVTATEMGTQIRTMTNCISKYFAGTQTEFSLTSSQTFQIIGKSNATGSLQSKKVNGTIDQWEVTLPTTKLDAKGISFATVSYSYASLAGTLSSKLPATATITVNFYDASGKEIIVKGLSENERVDSFVTKYFGTFEPKQKYTCAVYNDDTQVYDTEHCTTTSQSTAGIKCACTRNGATTAFAAQPSPTFFWLIPFFIAIGLILVIASVSIVAVAVLAYFANHPAEQEKAVAPINNLVKRKSQV